MKRIAFVYPVILIATWSALPTFAQDEGSKSSVRTEDGSFFGGESAAQKKRVQILKLNNIEAEALAETLKQFFENEIAVTAYPKTNRVALVGTPDQIEKAEKLVAQLDQKPEPDDGGTSSPPRKVSGGTIYYSPQTRISFTSLNVADLKKQYAVSNAKSLEWAAQYREESQRRKSDDRRLKELHKDLEAAVRQTFQDRQTLHRAEIAQLEQKIKKMKNLLEARERIKSEIIDRRVADLENPNRRWEEGEDSKSISFRTGSRSNPTQAPFQIGKILGVDATKQTVEISLGSSDAVAPGMWFTVTHPTEPPAKVVGQIEVFEVQNRSSLARIIRQDQGRGIEVGDLVLQEPANGEPSIGGTLSWPRGLGTSSAKTRGAILDVSEKRQMVELSLGAKDGIKLNTTLQVWRGDRYVGEVKVAYVGVDKCAAHIIKAKLNTPLQKGDRVGTELPKAVNPADENANSNEAVLPPELEELLRNWSHESSKTQTLRGTFLRFVYDKVFMVEKRSTGAVYYEAPSKGRIDIQPVKSITPGEKIEHRDPDTGKTVAYTLKQGAAERWICNGISTWQINEADKQVEIFPVPPNQGRNMIDGPLPFLFGMPLNEAKHRYQWSLVKDPKLPPNYVKLHVLPRLREDAANWRSAEVILDKQQYLPHAVKLVDPAGNSETTYVFNDLKPNAPDASWLQRYFRGGDKDPFNPDLKGYTVKLQNFSIKRLSDDTSSAETILLPPDSVQIRLSVSSESSEKAVPHITWTTEDGAPSKVVLPARLNVSKTNGILFELGNVSGHAGEMFFGTFANRVNTPAAELFARHSSISVEVTDEDLNQASQGNLVTKVFYVASNNETLDELVSSRLEPGLDPIREAEKQGDVLGVLHLGNRHSEIGANEEWREKFLRNSLKAIEAEREEIKEELLIFRDALEEPDLADETRAEVKEKVAKLENQLSAIERRRELYLEQHSDHEEKHSVAP